jgi:hypothetical protein
MCYIKYTEYACGHAHIDLIKPCGRDVALPSPEILFIASDVRNLTTCPRKRTRLMRRAYICCYCTES